MPMTRPGLLALVLVVGCASSAEAPPEYPPMPPGSTALAPEPAADAGPASQPDAGAGDGSAAPTAAAELRGSSDRLALEPVKP